MFHKSSVKKVLALVIPVFLLLIPVNYGAVSVDQIRLTMDGKDVTASAAPVNENGRTLVPVRFISEKLGATVTWDGVNQTVFVSKGDKSALLRIGSRLVEYNGGAVCQLSDVAPKIINSYTYVPLKLIGNALGIGVDWDEDTRTVVVDSTKTSDIEPFFDVKITSLLPGAAITGKTSVKITVPESVSSRTKETKLFLLDKDTGKGFVVADIKQLAAELEYLPRVEDRGEKVLVAALYDGAGALVGGDAVQVNVDVTPEVSLMGLQNSDVVANTAAIGQTLNFLAPYVRYEMENLTSGKVTAVDQQDPQGTYTWAPTAEQNGSYSVRVIAYDGNGNAYESQSVLVEVRVDKRISLTGVSAGATINKPVTLLASRNFDVSETQYVVKDVATGSENILATIPYGQYVWFPGPGYSGDKDLSVRVKDVRGETYESSPIRVKVDGSPKVLLKGIGPKQVVTGETKLSADSNVTLESVSYVLTNTAAGTKRTLTSNADRTLSFTPSKSDPADMAIQVVGTYQGQTIASESVSFKLYLGTIYGPKAIIEKDKFLGFASGLAKGSSDQTGMSAALQTAQAILETGWGQSVPVDKYSGTLSNNLFGIKGTGPNGSVTSNTWEVYNGVSYRVDAAFRAYNNVGESWDDRNSLLLTASRYEPFRAVMYDSTLGAWAVKRAGYATDPQYPIKLINIINQYNLLELDKVGI